MGSQEKTATQPVTREVLIEATDALLARGDDAFGLRDARIALILGVVHGMGLEQAFPAQREIAVAVARAGYALRSAEEQLDAVTDRAPLMGLLAGIEQERKDLLHWEAMQIAAWEVTDDPELPRFADLVDPGGLAGHPQRDEALALLADVAIENFGTGTPLGDLTQGDGVRAARFGYALRIAERSLPDEPSRLLR